MATQVIPEQPNMFANWGQHSWQQSHNETQKPAEDFMTQQMQQMNIPDPNAPQQTPVVPYSPEQKVVQQPVEQPAPVVQKQQTKPITDKNSETQGMDYLASLYTSPQQEEKLRKASIANQRIMAVTDALRHIGNIYGAVNGAVPQKFNNPVAEEELRYQKGKALRDAANYKYMTYQQAKAAQEAKQKQFETQLAYNAARDAAKMQATKDYQAATLKQNENKWKQQLEFNQNKWKQQADLNERKLQQQERHNKRMEGIAGMNAKTARDRATAYINKLNKGGNASTMPLQTPKGAIYAPGKSIPQAQMNQMYRYAVDHDLIAKSDFQKKMAEAGFGKADPDYVRNQLVAEAMMEHSELADFARDNYGWSYDDGAGSPSIGWDDEDNEDNGLSIGW